MHEDVRSDLSSITGTVVDAGLKVHQALGPGLLESTYEQCLLHELHTRGMAAERQVPLPIIYDGARIDAGYRIDLLVNGAIIVEVKAVEALKPIHQAQLLTYLKLSGCRIGLLMNFHVVLFKQGLKRLVL
jgi:GxxExxY protein